MIKICVNLRLAINYIRFSFRVCCFVAIVFKLHCLMVYCCLNFQRLIVESLGGSDIIIGLLLLLFCSERRQHLLGDLSFRIFPHFVVFSVEILTLWVFAKWRVTRVFFNKGLGLVFLFLFWLVKSSTFFFVYRFSFIF